MSAVGAQRRARRALRALVCVTAAACGGDATDPPPPPPQPPAPPAFVFVADSAGRSQLFRYRDDMVVRLTSDSANDADPRAAAGRVVFTSDRDGDAEVYLADEAFTVQRRVTNSRGTDGEPALDPSGRTIVFTSNRSGTPRLWVVSAPALADSGAVVPAPAPLATGSDAWVPERAPAWSPDGTRIAFTSTRTGTSQVFVVGAGGGAAAQLSHEPAGAFQPAWSGDGSAVVYVAAGGAPRVRRAALAGGAAADYAADPLGMGEPSCDRTRCLAVVDPLGARDGIVVLSWSDGAVRAPVATPPGARQPAVLVP
ncbi:MAG TPA: hypothetical protein VF041_21905 [Gemmatimonadaceae bacterium]